MAYLLDGLTPKRRGGERLRRLGLVALVVALAVLLLVLGTASLARAQAAGVNGISYSNQYSFRIPYEIEPGAPKLQEVQLYVSEDQGQNWQIIAKGTPDQRGFDYRAERDGMYYFTVRTIDTLGRAAPLTMQGTKPQLRVYIDTRRPAVTLRARPASPGLVAVEWDIREENLDPANFYLEYRIAGARDWTPLIVDAVLTGDRAWNPGANGQIDVRLRVRDLARNEGVAQLTLTPGSNDFRSASSTDTDGRREPTSTAPGRRYVNSKRISLNYNIKGDGPSGVSLIELWGTKDGRNWEKYAEDKNHKPPFVVEVNGEGLYGFTLIPHSGVGLSDPPPRSGDQPQIWVEVDLTPPFVPWVNVDVGRGQESGRLAITWKATDKGDNLTREPITISYSEQLDGKWTPIASNIPNDGKYIWTMPRGVPYKFYVRVEAVDKAGNVAGKETINQVIVDLALPKSEILEVAPATKTAPGL